MDQDNPNQSQTEEDNPKGAAEALTTTPASASDTAAPATDPTAAQSAGPARPRRPQRSARVEGSVDISEPKAEPKAELKAGPTPVANQGESTPDGSAASRPKPSRPGAVKPTGERIGPGDKVGPRGPGHHPVRAASVPHQPASRPVAPHLNPHAQRALSVAGTADTQAQTVEDFRQVHSSVCPNMHVSACPNVTFLSQRAEKNKPDTCSIYLYALTVTQATCL